MEIFSKAQEHIWNLIPKKHETLVSVIILIVGVIIICLTYVLGPKNKENKFAPQSMNNSPYSVQYQGDVNIYSNQYTQLSSQKKNELLNLLTKDKKIKIKIGYQLNNKIAKDLAIKIESFLKSEGFKVDYLEASIGNWCQIDVCVVDQKSIFVN